MMRKMMSATLMMCMIALLFTLSISAVHATPPTTASGTWTYIPTIVDQREADGNTFRYGEKDSTWTGTFGGTSEDVFTVVMHPSGFANVKGLINFVESDSDGENTLLISFVGKRTLPAGPWYGQWVILSGTGDLENLRGQGIWWGPPKDVDYLGKIYFESD